MKGDHDVLRALDSIGGWVVASELAYHLGRDAAYEAFEATEEGLVESRTYFSLTDAGRERLGLTGAEA